MMNLKYFKGIGSEIFGQAVDSPICMGPFDNPADFELLCRLSGKGLCPDDIDPSTQVAVDAKSMN